MVNFTFQIPTRLVFGRNRLEEAGTLASEIGERFLVMVGQSSARQHGYLDRLVASLRSAGLACEVYEGVSPNPRDTEADEAGALARKTKADAIIALGGGSVMDAAKLAAVVAATGGSSWNHVTGTTSISKALPLLVIPTVAGSGSEVANGAVITNAGLKQKLWVGSWHMIPRVALWDPVLYLTLPQKPTAEGAADMFCHVVERWFTALDESPVADSIAIALMKQTVSAADRLHHDPKDLGSREALALISSLAITSLTNLGRGGTFSMHAWEHVLSGQHDEVAHGAGLSALLSGWTRWMYENYPGRGERLDQAWGTRFRPWLTGWLRGLGLPVSLPELGVNETDLTFLDTELWNLNPSGFEGMTEHDTMKIWRYCLDR